MSRIATLLAALAVMLGALAVTAPAQADGNVGDCYFYDALPDDPCLSKAAFDLIQSLRTNLAGANAAYYVQAAETQKQADLFAQERVVRNDLEYRLAKANLRITALRAKVKELHQIIHSNV